MNSFLEWLVSMGLLFYGWLIPLCIGYAYVNEYNGNIYIGILIGLTAIPIEIGLYRLYKKNEDERTKKEREQKQAKEEERIKAAKIYQERIRTSPIRNLTPLEFEKFTQIYLKDRNYKQVELTKATGDFGADVIAIAPDKAKICVQCKMYSKPVGYSAITQIHAAKSYYKCERASVVATSNGFTKQAILSSDKVDVLLFAYDDYSREFMPVNNCARDFMSKNNLLE